MSPECFSLELGNARARGVEAGYLGGHVLPVNSASKPICPVPDYPEK